MSFRRMARFFFSIFLLTLSGILSPHAKAEGPIPSESSHQGRPLPPVQGIPVPENVPSLLPDREKSTKLIPLPIYATLPNEGSTFGLMPVLLVVDKKTSRTESIYAPSISWNHVIRTTGTMRWYHYPSEFKALTVVASASTNVNWGGLVIWEDEPPEKGEKTTTAFFRVQRSIFFRFFGLGPDTDQGAESSHTRIRGDIWVRRGWNLAPHFNLGGRIEIARDTVQAIGAPDLPLSPVVFAGTPGMGGGAYISERIDIRYDTRENRDYSLRGDYLNLSIGPAQGLASSSNYWIFNFDAKKLFRELDWLQGGARIFWRYVTSPDVPFYYQGILGGSFLMRGYTEDRFIDQGAWSAEFEQRIRVFQTHIYGVTADWRVDPFIAVGQVYHPGVDPFSNVKVTAGLGFRAYVKPNVLGRVDVATGGEGLKVYVELGYPF